MVPKHHLKEKNIFIFIKIMPIALFFAYGFKKRIPIGHCWLLQVCSSLLDPLQFLLLIIVLLHALVLVSFPPPQEALHGRKLLHSIQCGSLKVFISNFILFSIATLLFRFQHNCFLP